MDNIIKIGRGYIKSSGSIFIYRDIIIKDWKQQNNHEDFNKEYKTFVFS